MISILVEFQKIAGTPIIKDKFCLYTCTYVRPSRILNGLKAAQRLKAGGFRYDPGWGFGNDDGTNSPRELDAPQIQSASPPVLHTKTIDSMLDCMDDSEIPGLLVYAYNPVCLQKSSISSKEMNKNLSMRSNWNTMPDDINGWADICGEYTRHLQKKNKSIRELEIWNEPDLQPVFFTGSRQDYCSLYQATALAVRSVSSDFLVGGPAISNDLSWLKALIDHCAKVGLPLDFVSFHCYGDPRSACDSFLNLVRSYPHMQSTEWMLTEYNPYVPGTADFTTGGAISSNQCAIKLLDAFKYFLSLHDVNRIYWAQLQDPEVWGDGVDRCGLLDLNDEPKPAFFAWELFAKLPSMRMSCHSSDDSIGCLASANESQSALLIWNRTDRKQLYTISASGLTEGVTHLLKTTLYSDNQSNALIAEYIENMHGVFTGELAPFGVTLFQWQINDAQALSWNPHPMHVLRWHSGSSVYAEYDSIEQLVFLEAGSQPNGAPAWIGLEFDKPENIQYINLFKEADNSPSTMAVYIFNGNNTTCYISSDLSGSQPPWQKQWGKIDYQPLSDLKSNVVYPTKLAVFMLKTCFPEERTVWKLSFNPD